MDDLIRRQDALDEVERLAKFFMEKWHEHAPSTIAVTYALKEIPSAQQWIPCSERLPDIHEEVITCDSYGTQRVYTFIRISDDEVGWENDYGFYQDLEDVEAWMPLPEPYKGDEDGKC